MEEFFSQADSIRVVEKTTGIGESNFGSEGTEFSLYKDDKNRGYSLRKVKYIDYTNEDEEDLFEETMTFQIPPSEFQDILRLLLSDGFLGRLVSREQMNMSDFSSSVIISRNGISLTLPYYGYFYRDKKPQGSSSPILSDPPQPKEGDFKMDSILEEVIRRIKKLESCSD